MKSESNPMTRNNRFESVLKIPSQSSEREFNSRPNSTLTVRRRTSVTFDIKSNRRIRFSNESSDFGNYNSVINPRRMSAPELPPIQDRTRNSPIPSYHSSRYIRSKSSKPSNASDSSQRQHLAKSPFSAESSESNNSYSNARKVTNGSVTRSKTWVPPDQTGTGTSPGIGTLKLESISKKNTMSTPRSMNGYRTRLSSKDNSQSSGNNNTAQVKKKLIHCQSDPKISLISDYTSNKQRTYIRKKQNNFSSNKVLSVEKTDNLTARNKYNSGTVNGMRRYSSTIQLIPQKHVNDDEFDDDSGSDSDKDQMIISWLIGVDTEDPDEVPEPSIEYPDEPPQTDTAVHIVYNGDS